MSVHQLQRTFGLDHVSFFGADAIFVIEIVWKRAANRGPVELLSWLPTISNAARNGAKTRRRRGRLAPCQARGAIIAARYTMAFIVLAFVAVGSQIIIEPPVTGMTAPVM